MYLAGKADEIMMAERKYVANTRNAKQTDGITHNNGGPFEITLIGNHNHGDGVVECVYKSPRPRPLLLLDDELN